MKKVLVFGTNNLFIEDKLVEDDYIPSENEFMMETDKSLSFHVPKLVNGGVVEGLSQTEIDAIKNAPQPKTEIELLQEQNAELNLQIIELYETLITGGVI